MSQIQEELGDFIEASGLLEYDPEKIKNIYNKNPQRLLKRLWQTLVPILLYLSGVLIDKLNGTLKEESKQVERAKEFTELLVELGPAFIKAGQALSTRPDVVPKVVLEELTQLQDQLPGFESNLAMACIEEDLEKPINQIFKNIEREPISAASLGQVHKATLKNGEKVAVKIQRPGLREQITLDLYIVRNIAYWLKNNIGLIRSDLVGLIDELGSRVFEEMDYFKEATNAEKFKNLHHKNPKIAVPKIFREASSRRVLTMEWIDGVKLTNIDAVKKLGINPNEMIETGVNCSLQQLLEHGFFHADPHPGNILALEDGRLCYLDFGMMSEVTDESRTGLIKAVVHLVNRNFERLSQDFVELGFLKKDVDLRPIVPAFETVFTQALTKGVNKMDFKIVTDDMSGIMYKFPFRLPPYYALIIRSLITLEGIALSVDPKFKILGAAYPYFAKRLMEDPDPKLRESLQEMLFDGNAFQWGRLEDLVDSATKQTNININKLIDEVIIFIFSKNGREIRDELVEILSKQVDNIAWNAIKKISRKKSKNSSDKNILERKEIKKSTKIIKRINELEGFQNKFIFKRIKQIIKEPIAREMGINIIKRTSEKSLIRIVKVAAGNNK